MKRICIIGAKGQLGSEISRIAEGMDYFQVVCTDIAELDVSNNEDVKAFFEQNNFDFVINCAAYTAVDLAETEVEKNDLINNLAVKYIAEACDAQKALLIHISTDFVYDGSKCSPMLETDATKPLQAYGSSKLRGEKWVKDGVIIRTAWLYSSVGNNFVKTMMRLGADRDILNVVSNQIGTPTNASDLALVILTMCKDPEIRNKTGLYHYSNEGVASWYDFAQAIMEYAGLSCKVNPIPDSEYPTPAKRPPFSVLDKTKIKHAFNLEIPYWRKSLMECIEKMK